MLLSILRFLRGYVRFSVSGRFPERFLNIASKRSIRLFGIERGEKLTACMYMSDYRGIRASARASGVRLRIIERYGLPCYVRKYRSRIGVTLGAAAFLLTVFIMSLFIWSIDVTGLDTVSMSEMSALLKENGLYVGAFRPLIDDGEITRSVMLSKKEIGWMAVNIEGSYASVEVKEESSAPPVDDSASPCNIKASRDGLLLKITANNGQIIVPEGSGVIEGQLIVSGVMGGGEQSPASLVAADAVVWARTTRKASFSVPEIVTGFMPTGERAKRCSLKLYGVTLPYSFACVDSPDSYAQAFEYAPAPLGVRLPVGTLTEEIIALEKYEKMLTDKEAEQLLLRQSRLYECFSMRSCTVTDRSFELQHENGRYTLRVEYTCEEDIAQRSPIGTEGLISSE